MSDAMSGTASGAASPRSMHGGGFGSTASLHGHGSQASLHSHAYSASHASNMSHVSHGGHGSHARGKHRQHHVDQHYADTPASGPPSVAGSRATAGAMTAATEGLDLSFGITPPTFERINLVGSGLNEHAISSLVLSVPNITNLDLRGNNLNAAFGWKLVKAMKRRYLQLEFCNGVHTRALRDNVLGVLNLSTFNGHQGIFGIEVVGAIFLAHFLRLNSSVTDLCFRRNDVQKDGAKALAQSLLGNPQCVLRTVNGMGATHCPSPARGGKPGVDFGLFRSSTLQIVHLSKRNLDDDDFVFLEEWLRRYDCVTDLDISWNPICKDGVRKLGRHIKDTKTLLRCACVGLPVDADGLQTLVRAVSENETLEFCALPLGGLDDNPERQQTIQQLSVGLARHPCIAQFGQANFKFAEIREGKLKELRCDRMIANWPRAEVAVYMWFVAAVMRQGPLEKLHFGGSGKPLREYPSCAASPAELWPPVIGIVHDVRSLLHISLAVPRGYGPLMMEAMRALAKCNMCRTLHLLGYASAVMRDVHLPSDWSSVGPLPRWLIDDRLKRQKILWQSLYGLLSMLPHLESFNDIPLDGNVRDSPERVCVLLLQCLEGVAAHFPDPNDPRLVAHLSQHADVDAFCDVLRILSRNPIHVDLQFGGTNTEAVKAQQNLLIGPLTGQPAGDSGPLFTHTVSLKNKFVSEVLLQSLGGAAPILEFGYERIENVLPGIFNLFCGHDRPAHVERIRIEPKWSLTPRLIRKRYSDRQRRWLEGIRQALGRSDRFVEVQVDTKKTKSQEEIRRMSLDEFGDLMSGLEVDDPAEQDEQEPQTNWRVWPSKHAFLQPETPEQAREATYIPMPLDDETKFSVNLRKLSFCMCNLRTFVIRNVRPDEWAGSSRPLWDGPRRFIRAGDWREFESIPADESLDESADGEGFLRYHWRGKLNLGTRDAHLAIVNATDPGAPSFADDLLQRSFRSLLLDHPSLTSLDLRGNYLDREDANLILHLLEENQTLEFLNFIPLNAESPSVDLDGTGISLPKGGDDSMDYDDDDEPLDEKFTRSSLTADVVRLDEGDGYLFLSLVSSKRLPDLREVIIRNHEIPDGTLPCICDALLNVPSIERLRLSELKLSSRGSSLLLSALVEMASRTISLNGLPLGRLLQLRAQEAGNMPLDSIEWNDFSLGIMARMNLWPAGQFANVHGDDRGSEKSQSSSSNIPLQGGSLTDVGVRGLVAMLRYFMGPDRTKEPSSMKGPLYLAKIDLSGNQQVTDTSVADLCHALQHPTACSSLRNSLREVSVRSCMRLRTRSAFELMHLVQHVREGARDSSMGSHASPLCSSLQVINGVDVAALQVSARTAAGGTRSSAPPMLLRGFIETKTDSRHKVLLATLSECDTHFFASVLHFFAHIPHCHVHVVVPAPVEGEAADESKVWGSLEPVDAAGGVPSPPVRTSNDSPFPGLTPDKESSNRDLVLATQSQIDAARKLFEACPVATQLRFSMVPCVPDCEDILSEGDQSALPSLSSGDRAGSVPTGCFGQVVKRLQERAAKARRAAQRSNKGDEASPRRSLYVNNLNSQRLHDCFRTLYGQDDVHLDHSDILPPKKDSSVLLPTDVDITPLFGIVASVDVQHLDLRPSHLLGLEQVIEMPVLTHVNLNNNLLSDAGVDLLFAGLVAAGCNIVHISVSANSIGDVGASSIAQSLVHLPRLTSLELRDNFIQERGSIALAEAVGGICLPDDTIGDDVPLMGPLPVLSVDLRGNRSRAEGALKWAEVVSVHPSLQFLSLARNELGQHRADSFLGLVYAAVASVVLQVLDLRENFPLGPGEPACGPPPTAVLEDVMHDLPAGEFDSADVKQGVFIRRHRGGGGGASSSAPEKRR